MLCCVVGTFLLLASIVLCALSENNVAWMSCLIFGEVIAFLGYTPVFLKLLS